MWWMCWCALFCVTDWKKLSNNKQTTASNWKPGFGEGDWAPEWPGHGGDDPAGTVGDHPIGEAGHRHVRHLRNIDVQAAPTPCCWPRLGSAGQAGAPLQEGSGGGGGRLGQRAWGVQRLPWWFWMKMGSHPTQQADGAISGVVGLQVNSSERDSGINPIS